MKITPEKLITLAQSVANVALNNHTEVDRLSETISDKGRELAAELGFYEAASAIENSAMAANDLAEGLERILEDNEVDDRELHVLIPLFQDINRRSKNANKKCVETWLAMPHTLQWSEQGMVFNVIGKEVLRVRQLVLALGQMIGAYLEQGDDPDGGGGEPDPDPNPTDPDLLPIPIPEEYAGKHPGHDVEVPSNVNAIAWLMSQAKAGNEHPGWEMLDDGTLHIYCPGGEIQGATFGKGGWTPQPPIDMAWRGDKVTKVYLRDDTYAASHSQDKGWGSTFNVRYQEGWAGRIRLVGGTWESSGDNTLNAGSYGNPNRRLLEGLEVVGAEWVAHRNPSIRVTRPGSVNQADLTLVGVVCDIPNAWEHFGYTRNCRNVRVIACHNRACGGQGWQDVERPKEGYGYSLEGTWYLMIDGCVFHNFHRDPSRAGSCISPSGGGKEVVVRNTLIYDILEDGDRSFSYGACAVWNGGANNSYLANGLANGKVEVIGTDVFMVNPNRSVVKFHSTPDVKVTDCGFFWDNGKHIDVHNNAVPASFDGCNSTAVKERALARAKHHGIPTHLLDSDPTVRRIDTGEIVGAVSTNPTLD